MIRSIDIFPQPTKCKQSKPVPSVNAFTNPPFDDAHVVDVRDARRRAARP